MGRIPDPELPGRTPAFRGFVSSLLLLFLLSPLVASAQEPATPSQALLGSLYLKYLLSEELSEASWTLLSDALRTAHAREPGNTRGASTLLFAEAQLARARGQHQLAADRLARAAELDPLDVLPWLGLAETALDRGDSEEGVNEFFSKARELLPKSVPEFAHHLYLAKIGNLYLQAGRHEQAIEIYQVLAARKPGWGLPLRKMAQVYLQLHQHEQALICAQRAVAGEPAEARNHHILAAVRQARKETLPALESLRRAVELDPTNLSYHYDLGVVYESRGEKQAALHEFRQASSLASRDQTRFAQLEADLTAALDRLTK